MAEAVLIAGKTHLKDRLGRSPVSLNEKTKNKDPWLAYSSARLTARRTTMWRPQKRLGDYPDGDSPWDYS